MSELADALRAAYAERDLDASNDTTVASTVVSNAGYRLRFETDETLVEVRITQEAYYALGLADEQTDGAIRRALDRSGYDLDGERTRYSLDAIQFGRGPIDGKGSSRLPLERRHISAS